MVPPQDSQALAAALIKLLSDDLFAARIAGAGRDYVEQNFSFERLVADMEQLYAKLLGREATA